MPSRASGGDCDITWVAEIQANATLTMNLRTSLGIHLEVTARGRRITRRAPAKNLNRGCRFGAASFDLWVEAVREGQFDKQEPGDAFKHLAAFQS
jgi:hypothetical protein